MKINSLKEKTWSVLLFVIAICFSVKAHAAERFVSFKKTEKPQICLTQREDTILYDPADWDGVRLAIANLKQDLRAVTGSANAPIVVGTVGKSQCVKKYKDIARQLKGKWEQYIITTDGEKLVIVGSDKRGTIYGIYEVSRQIGVSPWYWWADAPVRRHDTLYVDKGTFTDGEPAVKYRGIFINDEWPSFGTWANNRFGGLNSKMYARLFELLLRLKANYLWPAMWNSRFNEDDPLSPKVADEMGIVMGTSHHEPMMRAHKEYTFRREEVGPWNYAANPERIERFFTEGLRRNKDYENVITIGMRGDGDVAMGSGDDAENMKTLKAVIKSQRRIIEDVYGCPADEVPQLWAIFTEVQRYYDAGFRVPDDVTLLFCDNNWGYIRRMGSAAERKRKGGLGLYYHIDMNGGPWNDRWVNTTTLPKLREQFNLAYRSGIDRLWIVNVGDLKPKEVPIDFIMSYAWNPDAIQPGDEMAYLSRFASDIFGSEYAGEVAEIIAKYSKYNLWRKPEAQVPGLFNYDEMAWLDSLWTALVDQVRDLALRIPDEAQAAFYQLVYYPAVASAGVARIYNSATRGDSLKVKQLMNMDAYLTAKYNEIAGGKWRGMMSDNHIGYTRWSIPDKNYNPIWLDYGQELNTPNLPPPGSRAAGVSVAACEYDSKVDGKNAKWIFLPDLGRGKGCMGIDNVMAPSNTEGTGPRLEYIIETDAGMMNADSTVTIALGILPIQDVHPARGLRIALQIDQQPMSVLDARQGLHDEFGEYTEANLAVSKVLRALPPRNHLLLGGYVKGKKAMRRSEVFDNIRWLEASLKTSPGKHRLKIIMIDPEIVVERIVVHPDNNHYSYFVGF